MKTIRLAALLLLALAAACDAAPTGPSIDARPHDASMNGQGLMGGGTRAQP